MYIYIYKYVYVHIYIYTHPVQISIIIHMERERHTNIIYIYIACLDFIQGFGEVLTLVGMVILCYGSHGFHKWEIYSWMVNNGKSWKIPRKKMDDLGVLPF